MRNLLLTGGRIILAYITLVTLTAEFGALYGRCMLPLYRWEIGEIASDYRIEALDLVQAGSQRMFFIATRNRNPIYVGAELVSPNVVQRQARALLGDVLQHVLLVLLVPLAWPGLGRKRRLTALLWAVPCLAVVEFVDMPLELIGALDYSARNVGGASLAMDWALVLPHGGRFALSLLAGLAAVGFSATRHDPPTPLESPMAVPVEG